MNFALLYYNFQLLLNDCSMPFMLRNLMYFPQARTTPLHEAAANNLKDIAELLISQGADVDAKDKVCLVLFRL